MALIYHVTTKTEWNEALKKGYYEANSLASEGFIHCSEERQVAGVLERYFKNRTDLVKLVIETGRLTSRFMKEWSSSVSDEFPHIYGPLNLDAVIEIVEL